MIGMKLITGLLGRKAKVKAIDAVMDKVNLPDPVGNAIKAAATGNVGGLVGDLKKTALKNAKKGVRK
jgi:hypothetical protein